MSDTTVSHVMSHRSGNTSKKGGSWAGEGTLWDFYTHHMIVAGYYGFTLDVRVSVHPSVGPSVSHTSVCPSVFPFRMII